MFFSCSTESKQMLHRACKAGTQTETRLLWQEIKERVYKVKTSASRKISKILILKPDTEQRQCVLNWNLSICQTTYTLVFSNYTVSSHWYHLQNNNVPEHRLPMKKYCVPKLLFVLCCLTSHQHARVSLGWTSSDNFTCCHNEIEVADKTLSHPVTVYWCRANQSQRWPYNF